MKPPKPENETPAQQFKRVAEARTNAVLQKLRILGNCSNRRLYRYSQEDVDKIFSTINKQIKVVRSKFETETQEDFNWNDR
jgi:hypothetical protein